MITALRRHFSPAFALKEDFKALDLVAFPGEPRYSCVADDGRFNRDPRGLSPHAFGYGHDHAPLIADVAAALAAIVSQADESITFDLSDLKGSVPPGSSPGYRTLQDWGDAMLAGSYPSPTLHPTFAHCLRSGLGSRQHHFSSASWMHHALYCETTASPENLALAIALASRQSISHQVTGRVTRYDYDLDVASRLCQSYGAWVFTSTQADAVKHCLHEHKIAVFWSFVNRTCGPMNDCREILYVPRDQEMGDVARDLMTSLMFADKCVTLYKWLDDFKYL